MFLELHILQNFVPANLNRDDTGQPKECEFGGHRRARVSSQCIKRSIRRHFDTANLIPVEHRAHRTKRLIETLAKRLVSPNRDQAAAESVVAQAIKDLEIKVDAKKSVTSYLLYLGAREIDRIGQVCSAHWDELIDRAQPSEAVAGGGARQRRQAAQSASKELTAALEKSLDGGKAADLALFGRMLADRPENNLDAACQVAHAISTNRLTAEVDYFTAVDDFKPDDTEGAGMIGIVEFNSSCFYRYANVDVGQLRRNLQDDDDLTVATAKAFARASLDAVPTGKQNSTAPQNRPSFALAVLRDGPLVSLANAFLRPVVPGGSEDDLIDASVGALDRYWGRIVKMYGTSGVRDGAVASMSEVELSNLGRYVLDGAHDGGAAGALVESVGQMAAQAIEELRRGKAA